MSLENHTYKGLRLLSPETAHKLAKFGMKRKLFAPGPYQTEKSKTVLFGVELDNPLGLAAGFDKNADITEEAREYGFGWIEIGSVTYRGGKGNSDLRLDRLSTPNEVNLWNRLGLNGLPAIVVADRLKDAQKRGAKFGVNIAKTHNPEIVGDKAIRDMVSTYKLVKDFGIYTALNLSCPNTKEGKTFEDPSALKELLHEINSVGRAKIAGTEKIRPLLIKISPTISDTTLRDLMIAGANDLQGYIATNTYPMKHPEREDLKGGGSGRFVRYHTLDRIRKIRKIRQIEDEENLPRKTIVGCGGISLPSDVTMMSRAGADVFQCYSGFVVGKYAGPKFAHIINDGFSKDLESKLTRMQQQR